MLQASSSAFVHDKLASEICLWSSFLHLPKVIPIMGFLEAIPDFLNDEEDSWQPLGCILRWQSL